MAHSVYMLLALALPQVSVSQTVVSSTTPFTDDFSYQYTDDFTVDAWYFPEEFDPPTGTGCDDLGGEITTCSGWSCGTEDQIWGWWRFCSDDPSRSMARIFECDTRAEVTIRATFYGCIENSGDTYYYMRVTRGSSTGADGDSFDALDSSDDIIQYSTSSWTSISGTPDVGSCNNNFRKYEVVRTLDVTAGQTIGVTFNTDLSGSNTNGNWAGFNEFSLTCSKVATVEPTKSPTAPTDAPSPNPSRSPTPDPSESPTRTPTGVPTDSPVQPEPTAQPTTPQPTAPPTLEPSVDPTLAPTKEPSFAPIPSPTRSPVPRPTKSPTEDVGLFEAAFGGGNGCKDGWIQCNMEVFVILLLLGVGFVFYWILGAVWYKRRQNNRPVPAHMRGASPHVEMGGGATGGATHATSSKWKSQWEIEQEQQAAQNAGQQPGW